MSEPAFCSKCGSPRPAGARFCATCGQSFGWVGPNDQPAETPSTRPDTAQTIAGLAWLACAGLTAYLAYLQWSSAQTLKALGVSPGDLETYAGWNALSAILTGYFGARLLTGASRRMLDWSAAWAVLSVLVGVVQIGSGATNDIFVLSILAAGAAGILSFVARNAMPRPAKTSRPTVYTSDMAGDDKLCGRCHERLVPWWTKCRHCGANFGKFPPVTMPPVAPATPPPTASPVTLTPTMTATPARQMGTVVRPTYIVSEEPDIITAVPASAMVASRPPVAEPPAPARVTSAPAEVPAAAPIATPSPGAVAMAPASKARKRPLVAGIVVIALVAAGVAGFALLAGGARPFAAASPTLTPTVTPTATPLAATPIPFNGTGKIMFGTGYDPDTLALSGAATKFKRTTVPIAWVAELKGPIGTDSLTMVIASRASSGDETFVYTEPIGIDNPDGDTIGVSEDLAGLASNKPGTYVVRLLRGPDVLAEGTVTLT